MFLAISLMVVGFPFSNITNHPVAKLLKWYGCLIDEVIGNYETPRHQEVSIG
jgi:hypothetical protein